MEAIATPEAMVFGKEIYSFLKLSGYNVVDFASFMYADIPKGIQFDIEGECLRIIVGSKLK